MQRGNPQSRRPIGQGQLQMTVAAVPPYVAPSIHYCEAM